MPHSNDDQRSSLAAGLGWASRITNIGLQLALPPLGGMWLDKRWGTAPWLLILGAVLGFCMFMFELLRIARAGGRSGKGGGEAS